MALGLDVHRVLDLIAQRLAVAGSTAERLAQIGRVLLTEAQQWDKLRLVVDVARDVWG